MPTTPPPGVGVKRCQAAMLHKEMTRVPSDNSGHYAAIPGTTPVLWEPAAPYADMPDAVPATMLPTPCTFLYYRTLGRHGEDPRMVYGP